jgi:hypothetical protein
MTVANAVWLHNPLTMATMYNTHQGVTHARGVTHMLYYISLIIIVIIITTTTIVIIVKINITNFDVFVIRCIIRMPSIWVMKPRRWVIRSRCTEVSTSIRIWNENLRNGTYIFGVFGGYSRGPL